MPMSERFKKRLFPLIPEIKETFSQPIAGDDWVLSDEYLALSSGFHVYDESGIRQTIRKMKKLLFQDNAGTNFFAVKACPNLHILNVMLEEGFGLDCASPTELYRAAIVGARPEQVMYTSNNTNPKFYNYARDKAGILNLDDISFLKKIPYMPERICFRYNPGASRQEGTNEIIGKPINQKYGLREDQIMLAYGIAKDMGAKIFGIHTMYASNCRDPKILAGNLKMQIGIVEKIQDKLNIVFEFINIGGGFGINYDYDNPPLDIETAAALINEELSEFRTKHGYAPKLYLESGRYVTGPHGVLVGNAINIMKKHKSFVGVDFCDAADILRAPIYPAYHEVSVLNKAGREKPNKPGNFIEDREKVSIVGPLCENMHMISDRYLPKIREGDYIVVHDTGAHGIAMSMKYNGWGCSQELLLRPDNSVVRISRAETIGDLTARERNYAKLPPPETKN